MYVKLTGFGDSHSYADVCTVDEALQVGADSNRYAGSVMETCDSQQHLRSFYQQRFMHTNATVKPACVVVPVCALVSFLSCHCKCSCPMPGLKHGLLARTTTGHVGVITNLEHASIPKIKECMMHMSGVQSYSLSANKRNAAYLGLLGIFGILGGH